MVRKINAPLRGLVTLDADPQCFNKHGVKEIAWQTVVRSITFMAK